MMMRKRSERRVICAISGWCLLALGGGTIAPAQVEPPAGEATPDASSISRTILLDGEFDDWSGLEPVAAGILAPTDAFLPDLKRVWCTFDEEWIYFRFEMGRVVNLQGLNGATLSLVFDADGDERTGATVEGADPALVGADLVVRFSPRREEAWFSGVDAARLAPNQPPRSINPYFLKAMASPTFANDEFEVRIQRTGIAGTVDLNAFRAETFSTQFVLVDENGTILDLTEPFEIDLSAETAESDATTGSVTALDRFDEEAVRLVSWNVSRGAIFSDPEVFQRVLMALSPDVICFQELGEKATSRQLREWLDEHVPTRAGWEVSVIPETGTGVASRLSSVQAGNPRPYRFEDGSILRTTSVLIGHQKRRVLVTSVHLTCCGRAGDKRDQKRIAQAKAIHRMIRGLRFEIAPSGLIIMGDFNLVGSRDPLDLIHLRNDLDGSDLGLIRPIVLGGSTCMTWTDAAQPFLPGRLDFGLFSDSVLNLSRSFVLDTSLLDEPVRMHYDLRRTDTAAASDHLPVIMDLMW